MKTCGILGVALTLAAMAWAADPTEAPAVIQTAELNPARPYFVPTHPRVTTTIRFPKEIGAPDGSVALFTEDAAKQSGEYLITWQQGDRYFTVTPLKEAQMANLNVPYEGETYVFYFYQVTEQLKAVASVNLIAPSAVNTAAARPPGAAPVASSAEVKKQSTPPEDPYVAPTAARLVGFLDRLKLIHATAIGPELAELAKTMQVDIAASPEGLAGAKKDLQGQPCVEGLSGEISHGLNDAGLFQIILLRAVRDRRTNCIGFICLVRNTSDQVLAFDVNSFGARAGAEYLSQRVSDVPAILKPGEQSPAYFVVHAGRNAPLTAANEWKISVDLVSPRLNPGAAIAQRFVSEAKP